MRAHAARAPWRAPAPSRDVPRQLRQQRRQSRQSQHRRRRQRQRGVRRLPACGPPSLYPQGTRGRRRCASEAHPPPLPARRPPRLRWFRLRWLHHRSVLSSRRAVVSATSRTMRSPRRFPRSSPLRARRCRTRYGHLHRSRHRSRRHRRRRPPRSRRRPRMPTRRMATRRMRPMQAFLLNPAFLIWDASRRRPRMAAAAARAGARHPPPPSVIAGTAAAAAAAVVVARAPAGTALAAVAVTALAAPAVIALAAVASERALGASTASHYTRRDLKRRMAPCRAARRRTALPPSRPRTSSAPSPAHQTPPHQKPTPHRRPLSWPTRLLPRSRSWRWALCRARRWALCRAWRWALCRAWRWALCRARV